MRVDTTLIPIVALIVAFGMAFVALHFNSRTRELRHRERLSALEKGIDLPPEPVRGPSAYLLRGLIWLFIGIAISIFFLSIWISEGDRDEAAMISIGLIPMGVGVAYLIVYRVEKKERTMPASREPSF